MSLFKKLLHKKEEFEESEVDKEEITENSIKTSNEIKNHFVESLQEQVDKIEKQKVKVETQIRPGDGMGFNSKISG